MTNVYKDNYLNHNTSFNSVGKLITLEGLDSCGKSSQIKQITKYLDTIGKTHKTVHFPMYDKNEFAKVISAFLRGEYGEVDEVNPLFLANIYAMDRYKYKTEMMEFFR